MALSIADLNAVTSLADDDIVHLRTAAGLDRKITGANFKSSIAPPSTDRFVGVAKDTFAINDPVVTEWNEDLVKAGIPDHYGTELHITGVAATAYPLQIHYWSGNVWMLIYTSSGDSKTYVAMITVDPDTRVITLGTPAEILAGSTGQATLKSVQISPNYAFVAYAESTNLYGKLIIVSGTTVTPDSSWTTIGSAVASSVFDCFKVATDECIVVCGYGSTSPYGNAFHITNSSGSIVVGSGAKAIGPGETMVAGRAAFLKKVTIDSVDYYVCLMVHQAQSDADIFLRLFAYNLSTQAMVGCTNNELTTVPTGSGAQYIPGMMSHGFNSGVASVFYCEALGTRRVATVGFEVYQSAFYHKLIDDRLLTTMDYSSSYKTHYQGNGWAYAESDSNHYQHHLNGGRWENQQIVHEFRHTLSDNPTTWDPSYGCRDDEMRRFVFGAQDINSKPYFVSYLVRPRFIGFAKNAAVTSESLTVQTSGIVTGFAGLEIGQDYYLDEEGVFGSTGYLKVGRAISATELLMIPGGKLTGIMNVHSGRTVGT